MGRYVGGIIIGWRLLDRKDGGGHIRLEIGIIAAVGLVLALMTLVRTWQRKLRPDNVRDWQHR